jgi:pimeloyl-ACP methyl ester carboxylesterase
MLRSSLANDAYLVSLDLPGFGGSDGLPSYGPDQVLTTIYLAIQALRHRHGLEKTSSDTSTGQCIVVGHDWGGVIASRIAAQTEGLIDHLVMVNSTFVSCISLTAEPH